MTDMSEEVGDKREKHERDTNFTRETSLSWRENGEGGAHGAEYPASGPMWLFVASITEKTISC